MTNPIRTYRKKKGLRQLDLALLLGVSEMTVCHWERGARIPSQDVLSGLGKVLGVPPGTLERGLKVYYEEKRERLEQSLKV